jgi:thiol-disulfide isomerase/thioredoxin
MPGVIPPELFGASFVGTPAPSGLSDEERSTYEQLLKFFGTHVAYGLIMGTRPQTLYGLADSPVALAAFMLDHGDGSGQPGLVQQVLEGRLERPSDLTRDDILDNITLFWLTNTGVSSTRLYWENKLTFFGTKGVSIPVGVSTFVDEIYRAPRSWAEQAYPNLASYNQHDRGGHFAAWEQPQLLSEDVRETFRSLRKTSVFEWVHMPALGGATEWLNSEPLGPAELRGRVVLVNFWTLTCINWLRQEPYVRAWSKAYRDDGLIVIGVHTPEFSFEHEIESIWRAIEEREIDYPVVVDNRYEIWSAFGNHYWPALYFVDTNGVIRDQHFGEGRYEQSERVLQELLGLEREPVYVEGVGVEAAADWDHLRTPETYLGYGRGNGLVSDDGHAFDEARQYEIPEHLGSRQWALAGKWTVGGESVVLDEAGGSIAYRFQARDANLVLSRGAHEPIPFRVLLDGKAPGASHGVDVDEDGNGALRDGRMYQLVRQPDTVRERTLEIKFLEPGAQAYSFTFG